MRDVTVAESKHFSLVDDILYHWYQRRVKKLPEVDLEEEVKFIKQIALPRELRKDALHAYHDSLDWRRTPWYRKGTYSIGIEVLLATDVPGCHKLRQIM